MAVASDPTGHPSSTAALDSAAEVAAQDLDICEALQRTASAGIDPRGRLSSQHENGVFQLHELVRRALAGTG